MQSFKLKFLGVTILQGVEFPIFLLIFEWALQQCSAKNPTTCFCSFLLLLRIIAFGPHLSRTLVGVQYTVRKLTTVWPTGNCKAGVDAGRKWRLSVQQQPRCWCEQVPTSVSVITFLFDVVIRSTQDVSGGQNPPLPRGQSSLDRNLLCVLGGRAGLPTTEAEFGGPPVYHISKREKWYWSIFKEIDNQHCGFCFKYFALCIL